MLPLQLGQGLAENLADVAALGRTCRRFLLPVQVLGQGVSTLAQFVAQRHAHLVLLRLAQDLGQPSLAGLVDQSDGRHGFAVGGLLRRLPDRLADRVNVADGHLALDDRLERFLVSRRQRLHQRLELRALGLDLGRIGLDQGGRPPPPGPHQPAVHGELLETAVEVHEEPVADLRTQRCSAVDHRGLVLAADLVSGKRLDVTSGLHRGHEPLDHVEAVLGDQRVVQPERAIDRLGRGADADVGGHLAGGLELAIDLLGQLEVLVDLEPVRRHGHGPHERELGLRVGVDLGMDQRHQAQRLGHLLVVPAHRVGVGAQGRLAVGHGDAHQVLLDALGELVELDLGGFGRFKHPALDRELEVAVAGEGLRTGEAERRLDVRHRVDAGRDRFTFDLDAALLEQAFSIGRRAIEHRLDGRRVEDDDLAAVGRGLIDHPVVALRLQLGRERVSRRTPACAHTRAIGIGREVGVLQPRVERHDIRRRPTLAPLLHRIQLGHVRAVGQVHAGAEIARVLAVGVVEIELRDVVGRAVIEHLRSTVLHQLTVAEPRAELWGRGLQGLSGGCIQHARLLPGSSAQHAQRVALEELLGRQPQARAIGRVERAGPGGVALVHRVAESSGRLKLGLDVGLHRFLRSPRRGLVLRLLDDALRLLLQVLRGLLARDLRFGLGHRIGAQPGVLDQGLLQHRARCDGQHVGHRDRDHVADVGRALDLLLHLHWQQAAHLGRQLVQHRSVDVNLGRSAVLGARHLLQHAAELLRAALAQLGVGGGLKRRPKGLGCSGGLLCISGHLRRPAQRLRPQVDHRARHLADHLGNHRRCAHLLARGNRARRLASSTAGHLHAHLRGDVGRRPRGQAHARKAGSGRVERADHAGLDHGLAVLLGELGRAYRALQRRDVVHVDVKLAEDVGQRVEVFDAGRRQTGRGGQAERPARDAACGDDRDGRQQRAQRLGRHLCGDAHRRVAQCTERVAEPGL